MSINHVGQKIVDGLNDLQKSIIELFGDSAKTIYGFQTWIGWYFFKYLRNFFKQIFYNLIYNFT